MQFKEKIKAMIKNKKTITYVLSALFVVVAVSVSYAYLTVMGDITKKNFSAGLSTGTMHLTFEDNDNGINAELQFEKSVVKKFKIINGGNVEASTGFNWYNLVNTYTNGSLSYNLKYSESVDGEYKELIPETNIPVSANPINQALANEVSVPAGKTYYYNLEITLNNLKDVNQDADLDALFTTEFILGDSSKYIYYTLTVDPNGGTWNTFTEKQYYLLLNNETMEIPDPTRDGYTFKGWEKIGESYEFVDKTFTMGVTNATLKALWDINSYKVTINVEGGTYPGPTEIDAEYGKTITLETPTKDGYEFGGWTVTGGTIDGNQLTITDPNAVTVTPIWTAKDVQYVVYHNKMTTSGTYTPVSADTDKDEGTKPVNTTFTPPVRTDFIGFTAPGPEPLTIVSDASQNTLTYNYSRNKYTLTVAKNEGTGGTDSQDVYYEATIDLVAPSKTGYNFTNWTKTSGNGTLTDSSFTMGLDGATIQANYSALPFAVTLNANGGYFDNDTNIVTKSITVTYDSTYGTLPIPTKSGYTFLGWYTSLTDGTEVKTDTKVNLSENQTLYAYWQALDNNIMAIGSSDFSDKAWAYKADIQKVVFENKIGAKSGATYSFDVSEAQNNGVMAYLVPASDSSKYTLYIQSDGNINANSNSSYLFYGFKSLESIEGLIYFDTSNVTDMALMFYNCSIITTLDLSSFNTSNVTDMRSMFAGCNKLTSLNISNFNTNKVANMNYMFSNCNRLEALNISSFNTSNVTTMRQMFFKCSCLATLDVSNFNTSKVTNMYAMFNGCSKLTLLDLSNFDTGNVTDMSGMFESCSGLTSLNLSKLNTSNVTSMWAMFYNCSSLKTIDLSKFDTNNVTNMKNMFYNCSSLTSLNVDNFNTSNVTDMNAMFYNCSSLTSLNVDNFNTSNVTDMNAMFYNCSGLTSLSISNFDTNNVTSMKSMFENCSGLTSLNVGNFNTSNVTDMSGMFESCSKFTSLNLSNFDTSKVTNMSGMFYNCSGLTSLNVSSFNTAKVTDMRSMFSSCSSLTSLDVKNFNTENVTDMGLMFYWCKGLTSLNLSNFNTAKVTDMGWMFESCSGLTSLNVKNFNTANVTDMSQMFSSCYKLTTLDLSSFNTAKVTNMNYMFDYCMELTSLNLSKFNTSNVTTMLRMFRLCRSLTTLNISNFDVTSVSNYDEMFISVSSVIKITVRNTTLRQWVINASDSPKLTTSNFVIG